MPGSLPTDLQAFFRSIYCTIFRAKNQVAILGNPRYISTFRSVLSVHSISHAVLSVLYFLIPYAPAEFMDSVYFFMFFLWGFLQFPAVAKCELLIFIMWFWGKCAVDV